MGIIAFCAGKEILLQCVDLSVSSVDRNFQRDLKRYEIVDRDVCQRVLSLKYELSRKNKNMKRFQRLSSAL